ncbi:hypothetical protein Tco_1464937 [Tanacetum coccineum]
MAGTTIRMIERTPGAPYLSPMPLANAHPKENLNIAKFVSNPLQGLENMNITYPYEGQARHHHIVVGDLVDFVAANACARSHEIYHHQARLLDRKTAAHSVLVVRIDVTSEDRIGHYAEVKHTLVLKFYGRYGGQPQQKTVARCME